MKQIIIVISVTAVLLLFFFLISIREVKYYMKQSFYSNAVVIVNTFEYEILSGVYIPSKDMKYIMLDKVNISVSDNTFYPDKSYIAFKKEKEENNVTYYLTLTGRGRYAGFAYENTKLEDLENLSNVVSCKKMDISRLLKEIKAKVY